MKCDNCAYVDGCEILQALKVFVFKMDVDTSKFFCAIYEDKNVVIKEFIDDNVPNKI